MPDGIIITKVPEIPKNCFECRFLNSTYFCLHVREHVGYWIIKGARHPKCPIRPILGKKSIKNSTSMTGAYLQKYAEGYNDCIDEIIGGKSERKNYR